MDSDFGNWRRLSNGFGSCRIDAYIQKEKGNLKQRGTKMNKTICIAMAIMALFLVSPLAGHAAGPGYGGGGPRGPGGGAGWGGQGGGPGWGGHGGGPGWGGHWGGPGWGGHWGGPGWGGRWGGPGWGPGWGYWGGPGIYLGAPFWGGPYWGGPFWGAPYWGGPYGYFAGPPTVVEESPPVFTQPAPQPGGAYYWYYCENPEGYYPYVRECPNGWMKVNPSPASPNQ